MDDAEYLSTFIRAAEELLAMSPNSMALRYDLHHLKAHGRPRNDPERYDVILRYMLNYRDPRLTSRKWGAAQALMLAAAQKNARNNYRKNWRKMCDELLAIQDRLATQP